MRIRFACVGVPEDFKDSKWICLTYATTKATTGVKSRRQCTQGMLTMTLQKRCAGSKAAKSARKVFRQENVAGDTTGGYEDVPVPDSESCRFRCIGSITKIKEGLFGPGAAANRS